MYNLENNHCFKPNKISGWKVRGESISSVGSAERVLQKRAQESAQSAQADVAVPGQRRFLVVFGTVEGGGLCRGFFRVVNRDSRFLKGF